MLNARIFDAFRERRLSPLAGGLKTRKKIRMRINLMFVTYPAGVSDCMRVFIDAILIDVIFDVGRVQLHTC